MSPERPAAGVGPAQHLYDTVGISTYFLPAANGESFEEEDVR